MAIVKLKPRRVKASEVGLQIPANVNRKLFEQGFSRGMQSNTLTIFKASYRAGFRAAKLKLRALRRQQGIMDFPLRAKMSVG